MDYSNFWKNFIQYEKFKYIFVTMLSTYTENIAFGT